jgi:hypothetical protein
MPAGNETARQTLSFRETDGKKETVMRKLTLVLTAAATFGMAAPAAAQSFYFGAGPGGVGVGVGPDYGYYDRDWNYGYRAYDDRGWRGGPAYGDCRTVRVQRQRPDGTIAVRTRRVCD